MITFLVSSSFRTPGMFVSYFPAVLLRVTVFSTSEANNVRWCFLFGRLGGPPLVITFAKPSAIFAALATSFTPSAISIAFENVTRTEDCLQNFFVSWGADKFGQPLEAPLRTWNQSRGFMTNSSCKFSHVFSSFPIHIRPKPTFFSQYVTSLKILILLALRNFFHAGGVDVLWWMLLCQSQSVEEPANVGVW